MTGIVALLGIARNKVLLLMTWTLLGAAIAGVMNTLLPVVYEASAKILIATPYWNDSTALSEPDFGGGKALAYGDEFTQQRMVSYARLVTTPLVTGRVTERLRLAESPEGIAKKLSGHIVPETVVLEVRARDASPARAALIADATAQQTIDVIKELERPPYSVVSPVQPVLTEPASVPSRPISPRTLSNIFCGAVIGLLLGLTYAVAREGRQLSRFRGDDAASAERGNILGVLTTEGDVPPDVVHNDSRVLRLEVAQRLTEAEAQSFVMTSPRSTPATGIVATLLAASLAESGSSTVVVSADFSAQHDGSTVGLGDLLCTGAPLDSAIQSDERSGISWIPTGTVPTHPTRELTGPRMRNLLVDLAGRYRYVIVVGPAVLELADAVDMASRIGAAILVDPVEQTAGEEICESERLLGLGFGTYLGRIVVAGRAYSQLLAER